MMGSIPPDTYRNIQQRLQEDPDNIEWTSPRQLSILKGETGKLGIKVKGYQGISETYTVIVLVKSECRCLKSEDSLGNFDRIVAINGEDIRRYSEDYVLALLRVGQDIVVLSVCRLDLKRNRDSFGSEFSGMSGRPLTKVKPAENDKSNHLPSVEFENQLEQCCCKNGFISVPVLNSPSEVIYTRGVNSENDMINTQEVLNSQSENIYSREVCHSLDSSIISKPKQGGCNLSTCKAENYVKFPHRVKWSETKTVTLDKGSRPGFGFRYKIKQVYRQDEWYTLVVEVKDFPAEGKLMVGDYIRSINGQALANPTQAFQVMDELEKFSTARIILQRPEGLISNLKGKITPPKDLVPSKAPVGNRTICEPVDRKPGGNPTICEPVDRKPVRQNSHISQKSTGSGKLFSIEQKQTVVHSPNADPIKMVPVNKPLDNNTLVSGLFNVERPRSSCSTSNESHMNFIQNEKLVDNSEVHLIVQEAPVLNNNNQVLTELQTNRTVKLPKIRIFICGNEVRTLAKMLIPSSFLKTDSCNNLYDCVKCTMDMSEAQNVSFMPWSSYNSLLQSEENTRLHASNDSLSNGETSRQKDNDFLHHGIVNAEIFIVPDEKFFQYCCQYLFTRTSLFLLTFNCAKLLNSAAGEILRIQNLIHSIRSCVGYDCNIMTYGLFGNEHSELGSPSKDEVRTLFYTPYGQQIRKYGVTVPDLILSSIEENGYQASCKELKKNVWQAVSETIQKQLVSILSVVTMHQLEGLRHDGKHMITDDDFTKLFKMAVPTGDSSLQHVVWTHLKEFGEILSFKAAPLNLPNNQQMDKLLFIDPEIILQHVLNLFSTPQKFSVGSDITKHYWPKLLNTGNISKDDILSVIGTTQSVSAEKILRLLLAFGIIFKHYVDQDGNEQYFFPYFLSDQGNLETHKTETDDACLYLQYKDQIHMSSMQFYQLAFSISSMSDSNKISVTSATSCTLNHQGHEIMLIHHKFEDRMQIIVRNERNKKLFGIYQWLTEACNSTLAPEIQYVLGPECPLHTKGSLNNLHVVEISGTSILCKTTRIEKHPAVKKWLQDQGSEKVYIKDLPYSVFHKLFTHLQISTTLGQDWKGLGGLLGLQVQDILVYETKENPAKCLLLDQDQTRRLTVHELIELLDHPDMCRQDLIELLQNWLDHRK